MKVSSQPAGIAASPAARKPGVEKRLQLYWINSIVEYTGRDILKQRAVCMVQRLNCHAPIAILQR